MSSLNVAAPASRVDDARRREHARVTWSSGDFARVGARMVLVGELLCRTVEVHAGERVLDVAASSGNTAISAARRGASVTARDFVEPLLEVAQARAELRLHADHERFDPIRHDSILSTR